jgi:hypothetical protein
MTLTIALVGLTSIGLVGCSIGEDRSTDLTAARNFPGYLFYYASTTPVRKSKESPSVMSSSSRSTVRRRGGALLRRLHPER